MKHVFADTGYWIALSNHKDQRHRIAMQVSRKLAGATLVTTDEVLVEFLTHFSGYGPQARSRSALVVGKLLSDPAIEVVPQSRESFLPGLDLYEAREDKAYSLTDCISMTTMRRLGRVDVMSTDAHFRQEGFVLLI